MLSKPIQTDPELLELIRKSVKWFEALSPEEKEAHLKAQRESWVRGEMGIGSDQDEAEYRDKMRKGINPHG